MGRDERKVVLYIAMSLDGFIADSQGGVDWLGGQEKDGEDIDSYSAFVEGIDTVIMGWNTYHQIVTELSPKEWPYEGLRTYVVTHRKECEGESSKQICFTKEAPAKLVGKLKKEAGKGIWICGGAGVVSQLMREDVIDRYYISVIPTLLGEGIRLFETMENEQKLRLIQSQSYNGIVELIYERRV